MEKSDSFRMKDWGKSLFLPGSSFGPRPGKFTVKNIPKVFCVTTIGQSIKWNDSKFKTDRTFLQNA